MRTCYLLDLVELDKVWPGKTPARASRRLVHGVIMARHTWKAQRADVCCWPPDAVIRRAPRAGVRGRRQLH